MAKAGFCSQCNAQVWVNEDGTCANGHSGECVSGVYDAGIPPQPGPVRVQPAAAQPQPVTGAPAKSNKKTIWIVVAVVLLLLCACCGIGALLVLPRVFTSAADTARQRSCFANERTMEGAYQAYLASTPGVPPVTDIESFRTNVLSAGLLKSMPVCPSGGTYSIQPTADGIKVICSVHGSYQDAPASSTP